MFDCHYSWWSIHLNTFLLFLFVNHSYYFDNFKYFSQLSTLLKVVLDCVLLHNFPFNSMYTLCFAICFPWNVGVDMYVFVLTVEFFYNEDFNFAKPLKILCLLFWLQIHPLNLSSILSLGVLSNISLSLHSDSPC